MKIVLDSNALMMPFIYKLNLDLEIRNLIGDAEIYIPSCVVGEMERIAKRRWEAKAALNLLKKYKIVEVKNLGDEGVLEAAKKLNAYLLTNDEELLKRAKREKVKTMFMKQNHLVMNDD